MSRHLDGSGTGHPILGFLDLLEAGLDQVTDTPAWSLCAEETEAAITRLSADLARLSEVETRLLGQAESLDLPGQLGASSLSAWLARTTRMTKSEAGRRTKLAKTLATHDQTRQAVARGDVLPEQATAITTAVDDLDDDLTSEREVAEKHLIEQATEGAGAYDYEKPTPHKLGLAFMEYIERYPLDALPKQGGLAATVVITATAETFTHGAQQAGHTDNGTGVSPGQLIRLACEAKIFPAVMDNGGHVLDLGRGTRFHTPAQRLALLVEQKHCQHPSCDTPGAFCHVHHTTPWADGGHTNTTDAVLLCPFHHHQAHATGQTYPMRT
jgi:hypothetical protein